MISSWGLVDTDGLGSYKVDWCSCKGEDLGIRLGIRLASISELKEDCISRYEEELGT